MPNYYPLINARFNERRTDANLHVFVAIIGDILSNHDKNQIHVHNHARVHTVSLIGCERDCDHGAYSRNGSPYSNKIQSFFSVISSWRLLNQENAHARVCDMENFYSMPMHLFLITGSEYGLVLITNVISKGSGESVLLCNLVRV